MSDNPRNSVQDYRYGYTTNIDLLADIRYNINPYDIESTNGISSAYTYEKWRYFFTFINSKIKKDDTSINSKEGEKITLQLINEFNTNPQISKWAAFNKTYQYRGLNNPITRDDIFAIQRYHKKTDPLVIIDGWLGTQTLKLDYSNISIDAGAFPSNISGDKLFPAVWGNKRFVITSKDYNGEYKMSPPPKSIPLYLTPYDPIKHNNLLAFDPNKAKGNVGERWRLLGQTINPNLEAAKINEETIRKEATKVLLDLQTKLQKQIQNTVSTIR